MTTVHTNSPSDSKIFPTSLLKGSEQPGNGPDFHLPFDADVLQLQFVSAATADESAIRFGNQNQHAARSVKRFKTSILNSTQLQSDASLSLILVPFQSHSTIDLIQDVQTWIDATTESVSLASASAKSILLTLQGVHIIWQPRRAVVFAEPSRMEQICQSLIDATFSEQELRRIETLIDNGWEQTQFDSKYAFEIDGQSLPNKDVLKERFQSVLSLRIALARLTPQVIVPHIYPPTIASQIGERLRERTRLPERLALVDERLNAQERIYDHCAQRTSEYVVARKGHILEWIIIILLLAQTFFWIIEVLSSASTSN